MRTLLTAIVTLVCAGTMSLSGCADSNDSGGSGSCTIAAPVGVLCVRGEVDAVANQEVLAEDGNVKFVLYPKGCFSSSCTLVQEASCAVVAATGGSIELTGTFCLENTSDQHDTCTADCNGGGFATCEQSSVAAGSYTASLGALELDFDVPSTLPIGGACVGERF